MKTKNNIKDRRVIIVINFKNIDGETKNHQRSFKNISS